MWRNYLRITFRNLWKSKFYSAINLFGLAGGLACFLFILLYVKDELSYDRYHAYADRLYRMEFLGKIFEQEIDITTVGDPWGPLLAGEYPEVERMTRLREQGQFMVRYDETSYREEDVAYVDSTFFQVFSLPLLQGDPATVLREPFTMVITPELARKYFGDEEPVGKSLVINGEQPYRVTGIMAPIPPNTHFHYDMLFSMASREESRSGQWLNFNFHTYLVLREGADPQALEAHFPQIARTYLGSQLEQFMGTTYDDFLAGGNKISFSLFPVTRIHLYSHKADELQPTGDIRYVYLFSFIGLFILALACINFMNLSTARSANRAREVGMRKVVGAQRRQLIAQFLSESVLLTVLALVLAASLVFLLLPYFNQLADKSFGWREVAQPWMLGGTLGLTLAVGLLAGSYPAFFLSGFRPIQVLKGRFSGGGSSAWLRNTLVVFQFAITVGLIVGTLVIYDQLSYIQHKKLGYDKEHVLVLNDANSLSNNLQAFKEEMSRHPQVASATITSYLPTPSGRNNNAHFLGRNPKPEDTHVIQSWWVDHDFVPTMGIELAEGRNFSREFPADSTAVLINEATARIFGLANPIGQEISSFTGDDGGSFRTFRVIGVMDDFHFESMHQKIDPMIIYLGNSSRYIAFRLRPGNIDGFTTELRRRWTEMAPGAPFDYDFLDDRYEATYTAEVRIARIIGLFTILAIAIACLGLLGLATFTAEQRTKEIGIRKVLGASVSNLFFLLTSQFTRWVLLASLFGLPVAYYAMRRWLEGFEYRTTIGADTLILAALTALFIALLTVSYQAVRTARIQPVRSLKYE